MPSRLCVLQVWILADVCLTYATVTVVDFPDGSSQLMVVRLREIPATLTAALAGLPPLLARRCSLICVLSTNTQV